MGELLNSKGLFPFQYRGRVTDANLFMEDGWGISSDDSLNIPQEAYKYGAIIHFGGNKQYANMFQLYVPNNNSGLWFRGGYKSESDSVFEKTWQKIG